MLEGAFGAQLVVEFVGEFVVEFVVEGIVQVSLAVQLAFELVIGDPRQAPRSTGLVRPCTAFVARLTHGGIRQPLQRSGLFKPPMPTLLHCGSPTLELTRLLARPAMLPRAASGLVKRRAPSTHSVATVTRSRDSDPPAGPSPVPPRSLPGPSPVPTRGYRRGMADSLDVDAMVRRFQERARAVRSRPLPPVEGAERKRIADQRQLDFMDFAMIGDADWSFEDGVLTLRIDLRPPS